MFSYRAPIDVLDLTDHRVAVVMHWRCEHNGAPATAVDVYVGSDVHRTYIPTDASVLGTASAMAAPDGTTYLLGLPGHRRYSA